MEFLLKFAFCGMLLLSVKGSVFSSHRNQRINPDIMTFMNSMNSIIDDNLLMPTMAKERRPQEFYVPEELSPYMYGGQFGMQPTGVENESFAKMPEKPHYVGRTRQTHRIIIHGSKLKPKEYVHRQLPMQKFEETKEQATLPAYEPQIQDCEEIY